jgi:hypothetical protein
LRYKKSVWLSPLNWVTSKHRSSKWIFNDIRLEVNDYNKHFVIQINSENHPGNSWKSNQLVWLRRMWKTSCPLMIELTSRLDCRKKSAQ